MDILIWVWLNLFGHFYLYLIIWILDVLFASFTFYLLASWWRYCSIRIVQVNLIRISDLTLEYNLYLLWLIIFFEIYKLTVVRLNVKNIITDHLSILILLQGIDLALTYSCQRLEGWRSFSQSKFRVCEYKSKWSLRVRLFKRSKGSVRLKHKDQMLSTHIVDE